MVAQFLPPEVPGEVSSSLMGREEAQDCVNSIRFYFDQARTDLESARAGLLKLSERKGWVALGYASWRECAVSEFKTSRTSVYRELTAAKVAKQICPERIGSIRTSHLELLAKLPEGERSQAWRQIEDCGERITGPLVERIVEERLERLAITETGASFEELRDRYAPWGLLVRNPEEKTPYTFHGVERRVTFTSLDEVEQKFFELCSEKVRKADNPITRAEIEGLYCQIAQKLRWESREGCPNVLRVERVSTPEFSVEFPDLPTAWRMWGKLYSRVIPVLPQEEWGVAMEVQSQVVLPVVSVSADAYSRLVCHADKAGMAIEEFLSQLIESLSDC